MNSDHWAVDPSGSFLFIEEADRLFVESGSHDAIMIRRAAGPNNSLPMWDGISQAYRDAWVRLINEIANEPRRNNELIFATIFLFRHYVEIRLKEIILAGRNRFNLPEDKIEGHSLTRLWQKVLEVFTLREDVSQNEQFLRAGCIIKELDTIDPNSQDWRYPTAKEGKKERGSLVQCPVEIDPYNLRTVMMRLSNHLEVVSSWIVARNEDFM